MRWLFATLGALGLVFATAVSAQDFPELEGRVVDAADILTVVEEAELTAKLEALEEQSERQFVVATIPDLEGYDIADYGYRLGREWGIGDAERNDGVLLIVAPNERKVRIEVGYGLEGILTDAASRIIIDREIIPAFKAGDLPGGITAGSNAIIALVSLPDDEAAAQAAQLVSEAREAPAAKGEPVWLLPLLLFSPWFFIIIIVVLASKHAGTGTRYRGSSSGSWISTRSSYSGGSSFSSSSSFSGGGGSFGGGGASGSW